MWAADRTAQFIRNQRGTAILEFTIVAWFFFVAILGIIEFSLYFWQFSAISKGVQTALRYAVVSDPVTGDWDTLQPNASAVITCRSTSTGAASCTPHVNAANSAAMDCIVDKVRAYASFVEPENVVVEYRANPLGLQGFQAPTISIRLENLQFMTIFLGFMGGRLLPNLNYAMTAEDSNSLPPGPSPSGPSSGDCGAIP
ncbi:MAG: pilus assembly protein [Aestuariivirga sp.]|nr:pilus assembly protein [Aestuariivirga sp.]